MESTRRGLTTARIPPGVSIHDRAWKIQRHADRVGRVRVFVQGNPPRFHSEATHLPARQPLTVVGEYARGVRTDWLLADMWDAAFRWGVDPRNC